MIENYKILKFFSIGFNALDEKLLKNNRKMYKFPPNLEELGISNNFTKETHDFIFNNLNLENIKTLYIYANEFDSLKKFEQI